MLAGKTASDDTRFAVKDGVLAITGWKDKPPKITEIDTVESYDGDFNLHLEFRASRDANSGRHRRGKVFANQLQIRDYPASAPTRRSRATGTPTGFSVGAGYGPGVFISLRGPNHGHQRGAAAG